MPSNEASRIVAAASAATGKINPAEIVLFPFDHQSLPFNRGLALTLVAGAKHKRQDPLLTNAPGAFISAMKRLGAQNLAEEQPSRVVEILRDYLQARYPDARLSHTSTELLLAILGGLFVLRIYESALIRQTESELIAQGALVDIQLKGAGRTTFSRGGDGRGTDNADHQLGAGRAGRPGRRPRVAGGRAPRRTAA